MAWREQKEQCGDCSFYLTNIYGILFKVKTYLNLLCAIRPVSKGENLPVSQQSVGLISAEAEPSKDLDSDATAAFQYIDLDLGIPIDDATLDFTIKIKSSC